MMATEPRDPREAGSAAPLPQNIEAEAALLGALMIDNRLCDRIADRLEAAHFFEPLHARIYEALIHEHSLGRKATPVSLRPYFANDPTIAEVGGPAYLAQLTGSGAAVIGADDFARQVVELARLRSIIGVGHAIAAKAADTSEDVSFASVVAYAEAEIAEISRESIDGAEELSAADCADRAIRAGENSQTRGLLSGCVPIDEAIGQIRRQQLVIVGARPGMGKSALATDYAIGAARRGLELFERGEIERPTGIILFSLEMSDEEIGARMLSSLTFNFDGHGVPYENIEAGLKDRAQIRKVMAARDLLEKLPIQVIDIGQSTTARLGSLIRRWKRRFDARGIDLELAIVDYLQKLKPASA
jgi:replicative DNA helicase